VVRCWPMKQAMRFVLWALFLAMSACEGCSVGCAGCGEGATEALVDEVEAPEAPVRGVADAAAPPAHPEDAPACARIVVVEHDELRSVMSKSSRTKAEAERRAQELRERIVTAGEPFADVASKESDREQVAGGGLGGTTYGTWPERYAFLREIVFDMEVGDVSPVLDTKVGFVFATRCPEEEVRVSHILIRYQGAFAAAAELRRSKAAARQKAEEIVEALQRGEDWAVLAEEYSEDEATSRKAGYLGEVRIGSLYPEFEEAAFALKAGETSGVVETRFGYHVIRRLTSQGGAR
jgi:hypothetical protein